MSFRNAVLMATMLLGATTADAQTRFYMRQGGIPKGPAVSTPAPTWRSCAVENQRCSFTGTFTVRYGVNGVYATRTGTNGIDCSNNVFGDPYSGIVKACDYLA